MLDETVAAFDVNKEAPAKFLDLTFGAGGHTKALLKKFPNCTVYALDRDNRAIELANELKETTKFVASFKIKTRIDIIKGNSNLV